MQTSQQDHITVALAQIAPVWLNRIATTAKIVDYIQQAAKQGARLVCFGETLLPGYPFWLDLTDGGWTDGCNAKRRLFQIDSLSNAKPVD